MADITQHLSKIGITPSKSSIGTNEFLILSSLLEGEKYGLELVDAITELTDSKRRISLAAIHITLHRMEKKGLIKSRWGEPVKRRKGARPKYYEPTAGGLRAVLDNRDLMTTVLKRLESIDAPA